MVRQVAYRTERPMNAFDETHPVSPSMVIPFLAETPHIRRCKSRHAEHTHALVDIVTGVVAIRESNHDFTLAWGHCRRCVIYHERARASAMLSLKIRLHKSLT
jgi:hypothetical protein